MSSEKPRPLLVPYSALQLPPVVARVLPFPSCWVRTVVSCVNWFGQSRREDPAVNSNETSVVPAVDTSFNNECEEITGAFPSRSAAAAYGSVSQTPAVAKTDKTGRNNEVMQPQPRLSAERVETSRANASAESSVGLGCC